MEADDQVVVSDNEEINIYDDIVDFDLGEEVEKLRAENKKLEENVHTLEEDIKELKETKDNLAKNISTLFVTAKAEIERKNRMIEELRTQVDNRHLKRFDPNFERKRKDIERSPSDANKTKRTKREDDVPKNKDIVSKPTGRHRNTERNDDTHRSKKDKCEDNAVTSDAPNTSSRESSKSSRYRNLENDKVHQLKRNNYERNIVNSDSSDVDRQESISKYSNERHRKVKDDDNKHRSKRDRYRHDKVNGDKSDNDRHERTHKYLDDRYRQSEDDDNRCRSQHSRYSDQFADTRNNARSRHSNDRYNDGDRFNSRNKYNREGCSYYEDSGYYSQTRHLDFRYQFEDRYDSRSRHSSDRFSDRYDSRRSRHGSDERNIGGVDKHMVERQYDEERPSRYDVDSEYIKTDQRTHLERSERPHSIESVHQSKQFHPFASEQESVERNAKVESRSVTPMPEPSDIETPQKRPKKRLKMLEEMENKVRQQRLSLGLIDLGNQTEQCEVDKSVLDFGMCTSSNSATNLETSTTIKNETKKSLSKRSAASINKDSGRHNLGTSQLSNSKKNSDQIDQNCSKTNIKEGVTKTKITNVKTYILNVSHIESTDSTESRRQHKKSLKGSSTKDIHIVNKTESSQESLVVQEKADNISEPTVKNKCPKTSPTSKKSTAKKPKDVEKLKELSQTSQHKVNTVKKDEMCESKSKDNNADEHGINLEKSSQYTTTNNEIECTEGNTLTTSKIEEESEKRNEKIEESVKKNTTETKDTTLLGKEKNVENVNAKKINEVGQNCKRALKEEVTSSKDSAKKDKGQDGDQISNEMKKRKRSMEFMTESSSRIKKSSQYTTTNNEIECTEGSTLTTSKIEEESEKRNEKIEESVKKNTTETKDTTLLGKEKNVENINAKKINEVGQKCKRALKEEVTSSKDSVKKEKGQDGEQISNEMKKRKRLMEFMTESSSRIKKISQYTTTNNEIECTEGSTLTTSKIEEESEKRNEKIEESVKKNTTETKDTTLLGKEQNVENVNAKKINEVGQNCKRALKEEVTSSKDKKDKNEIKNESTILPKLTDVKKVATAREEPTKEEKQNKDKNVEPNTREGEIGDKKPSQKDTTNSHKGDLMKAKTTTTTSKHSNVKIEKTATDEEVEKTMTAQRTASSSSENNSMKKDEAESINVSSLVSQKKRIEDEETQEKCEQSVRPDETNDLLNRNQEKEETNYGIEEQKFDAKENHCKKDRKESDNIDDVVKKVEEGNDNVETQKEIEQNMDVGDSEKKFSSKQVLIVQDAPKNSEHINEETTNRAGKEEEIGCNKSVKKQEKDNQKERKDKREPLLNPSEELAHGSSQEKREEDRYKVNRNEDNNNSEGITRRDEINRQSVDLFLSDSSNEEIGVTRIIKDTLKNNKQGTKVTKDDRRVSRNKEKTAEQSKEHSTKDGKQDIIKQDEEEKIQIKDSIIEEMERLHTSPVIKKNNSTINELKENDVEKQISKEFCEELKKSKDAKDFSVEDKNQSGVKRKHKRIQFSSTDEDSGSEMETSLSSLKKKLNGKENKHNVTKQEKNKEDRQIEVNNKTNKNNHSKDCFQERSHEIEKQIDKEISEGRRNSEEKQKSTDEVGNRTTECKHKRSAYVKQDDSDSETEEDSSDDALNFYKEKLSGMENKGNVTKQKDETEGIERIHLILSNQELTKDTEIKLSNKTDKNNHSKDCFQEKSHKVRKQINNEISQGRRKSTDIQKYMDEDVNKKQKSMNKIKNHSLERKKRSAYVEQDDSDSETEEELSDDTLNLQKAKLSVTKQKEIVIQNKNETEEIHSDQEDGEIEANNKTNKNNCSKDCLQKRNREVRKQINKELSQGKRKSEDIQKYINVDVNKKQAYAEQDFSDTETEEDSLDDDTFSFHREKLIEIDNVKPKSLMCIDPITSLSDSSTSEDAPTDLKRDNKDIIEKKFDNLIKQYMESIENTQACEKVEANNDVVSNNDQSDLKEEHENLIKKNTPTESKIKVLEVITISTTTCKIESQNTTKVNSNDSTNAEKPSASCSSSSIQNCTSNKFRIRRRIVPTPVRQSKLRNFERILTKSSFSDTTTNVPVTSASLQLTYEGEIPVLHLEENQINNLPTEVDINSKNIINLLDSMNISNIDSDIDKFKSVSGESVINTEKSKTDSDKSLTFENIIDRVSTTSVVSEKCQEIKSNMHSNSSASSSVQSDTTTCQRRRRRCRLIIKD